MNLKLGVIGYVLACVAIIGAGFAYFWRTFPHALSWFLLGFVACVILVIIVHEKDGTP